MLVTARTRLMSRAGCSTKAAQTKGFVCGTQGALSIQIGSRRSVEVRAVDPSVATSVIHAATQHAQLIAQLAEDAPAAAGSGPFDFLAVGFEQVLEVFNDLLEKAHVPYSYGFAIILLTIVVKLATFPLTQKQVQSTVAIQALQPRVKELQAKHANDQETLQLETARLYRDAGVNPLAGCLPTLATIPVFIGLYRALTLAAQDNLLDQDFFWIPSLSGPGSVVAGQSGSGFSWLFPFVNGAPPIGWQAAGAYLVLPVLLIVSQYISQKIISPPQSNDPAQQQSQAILQFLPLMIGWFSLNVPAGLTLYWFVNNILSTAQQVYLKRTTKINIPTEPAPPAGVIQSSTTPYISPKEEKVKKVLGKDLNARKKRRDGEDDGDVIDVEVTNASTNGQTKAKTVSGGKGEKFRARKARDAAGKAAASVGAAASSSNSSTAQGGGSDEASKSS